MAKLVIIPEDRLRELVDRAVRQAVRKAVDDVLAESTSVDVPLPGADPIPAPDPSESTGTDSRAESASETTEAPTPSENGDRHYVIGRAEGEYSYADVVAIEYPEPIFRYDDAWKAIKGKIVTESDRAKGSTRRSLDTDNRFERVDNDREGIWFRRTDMEQLTMTD